MTRSQELGDDGIVETKVVPTLGNVSVQPMSPYRDDPSIQLEAVSCLSIKGPITTANLGSRRVLDPVEWDHVTVVGLGHIETCKDLSLVGVQVGRVSQLTRNTGKERRRS